MDKQSRKTEKIADEGHRLSKEERTLVKSALSTAYHARCNGQYGLDYPAQ